MSSFSFESDRLQPGTSKGYRAHVPRKTHEVPRTVGGWRIPPWREPVTKHDNVSRNKPARQLLTWFVLGISAALFRSGMPLLSANPFCGIYPFHSVIHGQSVTHSNSFVQQFYPQLLRCIIANKQNEKHDSKGIGPLFPHGTITMTTTQ